MTTLCEDRRVLRSNGRVADIALKGAHKADSYATPAPRRVTASVAGLRGGPTGGLDKELLFGQAFHVLETHAGQCFGFDPVDGYVGYIREAALGPWRVPTHRTSAASHIYSAPDIKSPTVQRLSAAAQLTCTGQDNSFLQTEGGWVPAQHLCPIDTVENDPVTVAEHFLHTPYLWAGNSSFGIDCSGLTQMALLRCGIPCPRDSDQQQAAFPETTGPLQRGDLIFWKGHVGLLRDANTLIHANAHHMAVAVEPLDQAIARIARKEFGEVTKTARPAA